MILYEILVVDASAFFIPVYSELPKRMQRSENRWRDRDWQKKERLVHDNNFIPTTYYTCTSMILILCAGESKTGQEATSSCQVELQAGGLE